MVERNSSGLFTRLSAVDSPWVDMGTAIGLGMWVASLCESAKGKRVMLVVESMPRVAAAILGGAIGGAIAGLVGWTGANLFGYR